MESIRAWIVSLSAASMVASAAGALVPKNAAGKATSLAGRALVMAVLLSPIGKVDFYMFNEASNEISRRIELSSEGFYSENEKLRQNIIEDETAAYILQRAQNMDVSCEVSVFAEEDIPKSATIKLKDKEAIGKLTEIIATECGIAKERQMYKISEV